MCGDVTVNAWLFIMFVTRHHAKHVLNYEYLTAARILHSIMEISSCENDPLKPVLI